MQNINFNILNEENINSIISNGVNHNLLVVGSEEDKLLAELTAIDRKYLKLLNDPIQGLYYDQNLKRWDIERNYILDKINPPPVTEEGWDITLDDIMYFE